MGEIVYGSAQESENPEQRHSEHLVALRPDVLDDAEHAVGNLLQRMYHVSRVAREGLGPHAERLTGALQDLERLLELVFDYISPVEIELRPVAAASVAESLAAQVRGISGGAVAVGECPVVPVLADSRLLRRSFQLMGRVYGRDWWGTPNITLQVAHDTTLERAEFVVVVAPKEATSTAVEADLAHAVATRLIDLHGGELRHSRSPTAVTCSIILPTSKGLHDPV